MMPTAITMDHTFRSSNLSSSGSEILDEAGPHFMLPNLRDDVTVDNARRRGLGLKLVLQVCEYNPAIVTQVRDLFKECPQYFRALEYYTDEQIKEEALWLSVPSVRSQMAGLGGRRGGLLSRSRHHSGVSSDLASSRQSYASSMFSNPSTASTGQELPLGPETTNLTGRSGRDNFLPLTSPINSTPAATHVEGRDECPSLESHQLLPTTFPHLAIGALQSDSTNEPSASDLALNTMMHPHENLLISPSTTASSNTWTPGSTHDSQVHSDRGFRSDHPRSSVNKLKVANSELTALMNDRSPDFARARSERRQQRRLHDKSQDKFVAYEPLKSKTSRPRVPCPEIDCEKWFQKKSEMINHVRAEHEKEKVYVCQHGYCTHSTTRETYANQHHTSNHRHERCPNNGVSCPRFRQLWVKKIWGCTLCVKVFENSEEWATHYWEHYNVQHGRKPRRDFSILITSLLYQLVTMREWSIYSNEAEKHSTIIEWDSSDERCIELRHALEAKCFREEPLDRPGVAKSVVCHAFNIGRQQQAHTTLESSPRAQPLKRPATSSPPHSQSSGNNQSYDNLSVMQHSFLDPVLYGFP